MQHGPFDYLQAARSYLETNGRPVAFYSDKHTVFRVARPDATRGDGLTQFGRALAELNIDLICANSPRTCSTPGGLTLGLGRKSASLTATWVGGFRPA